MMLWSQKKPWWYDAMMLWCYDAKKKRHDAMMLWCKKDMMLWCYIDHKLVNIQNVETPKPGEKKPQSYLSTGVGNLLCVSFMVKNGFISGNRAFLGGTKTA